MCYKTLIYSVTLVACVVVKQMVNMLYSVRDSRIHNGLNVFSYILRYEQVSVPKFGKDCCSNNSNQSKPLHNVSNYIPLLMASHYYYYYFVDCFCTLFQSLRNGFNVIPSFLTLYIS